MIAPRHRAQLLDLTMQDPRLKIVSVSSRYIWMRLADWMIQPSWRGGITPAHYNAARIAAAFGATELEYRRALKELSEAGAIEHDGMGGFTSAVLADVLAAITRSATRSKT